jgi:hypothetical protein
MSRAVTVAATLDGLLRAGRTGEGLIRALAQEHPDASREEVQEAFRICRQAALDRIDGNKSEIADLTRQKGGAA